MNDRVNCLENVGRVVDDCGGVTCTYAQSRLTAGVCCLNHAGAACCKDDVSLLHDGVGHVERGHVNPVDDSLGSACCNCRFKNKLSCGNGGVLCTGVGGDDDCVSCLKCDEALENCGRGGVCGRDNCGNYADRLGNLLNTERLILFDYSAGLGVLICIIDVLCGIVILDNLVLNYAHACFSYCHLCKGNSCLICCRSCCQENFVNLLLSVGSENSLRLTNSVDGREQALYTVYNLILFHWFFLLIYCDNNLYPIVI